MRGIIIRPVKLLALLLLSVPGCAVEVAPPYGRDDRPWIEHPLPDVPPGNIKITIDTFRVSDEECAAFDLAMKFEDRAAVVAVGGPLHQNGFSVMAGVRRFVVDFRAQAASYGSFRHESAFIIVADGHEASLSVVRGLPRVDAIEVPVMHAGAVLRTVRLLPTGSGFSVVARHAGGRAVDLQLTPWILDDNGREVVFAEASAHLVVEAGRPYAISGVGHLGRAVFSRWTETSRGRTLQVLTVELP